MRLKTQAVLGLVAAGSLLLAACSSGSSTSSSTTSAAATSAAASGSAAASSAAGSGAATATTGKIGVILPDTKSSARWETQDRPNLEAAFKKAGVEFDIQNANGDKAAMATIADGMIAGGVTVLAIVNLDSESGAAIEKKAKAQGVQTIDYDRLTLGGSADYYVSFNNTTVGELQGQGLVDCLGDGNWNIVYLNGSPSDSNATAFSAGAHSVTDPLTNLTVVAEQAVPDWDNQQAGTIYEQMFTAQGG
ncbi:MAG TPA: substrate-binding domain-containing protein, partial [Mycobacterium sp.]